MLKIRHTISSYNFLNILYHNFLNVTENIFINILDNRVKILPEKRWILNLNKSPLLRYAIYLCDTIVHCGKTNSCFTQTRYTFKLYTSEPVSNITVVCSFDFRLKRLSYTAPKIFGACKISKYLRMRMKNTKIKQKTFKKSRKLWIQNKSKFI